MVLRDFSPLSEIDECRCDHQDALYPDDAFIARLISNGLLLEIEYGTLHLDAYTLGGSGFYFKPQASKIV